MTGHDFHVTGRDCGLADRDCVTGLCDCCMTRRDCCVTRRDCCVTGRDWGWHQLRGWASHSGRRQGAWRQTSLPWRRALRREAFVTELQRLSDASRAVPVSNRSIHWHTTPPPRTLGDSRVSGWVALGRFDLHEGCSKLNGLDPFFFRTPPPAFSLSPTEMYRTNVQCGQPTRGIQLQLGSFVGIRNYLGR